MNNDSNHGSAGFCNHVLAFNVGNEIFCKFSLPESLAGVRSFGLYMCVYKESIAVVDHNVSASQFCVWVMGEYGIRESCRVASI
uniref:Uncharacterized protein n=1 Tax=Rhizophora mucronata TaxID=61149 RepID=A0A2P2JVN9_RHIMU